MSEIQADKTYKVILIGDSRVGKTCILRRYVSNEFTHSTISTIGVAFGCKTLSLDNTTITLNILDTAGQEMYKSITPTYYRQAIGAFIVFDVTSRESFTNINSWLSELHSNCDSNNIIKLLIGNKIDLPRVISNEEANSFAYSHRLPYIETSALSDQNITKAFESLARNINNARKSVFAENEEISPIPKTSKKIVRTNPNVQRKNSCCCGRDYSV